MVYSENTRRATYIIHYLKPLAKINIIANDLVGCCIAN